MELWTTVFSLLTFSIYNLSTAIVPYSFPIYPGHTPVWGQGAGSLQGVVPHSLMLTLNLLTLSPTEGTVTLNLLLVVSLDISPLCTATAKWKGTLPFGFAASLGQDTCTCNYTVSNHFANTVSKQTYVKMGCLYTIKNKTTQKRQDLIIFIHTELITILSGLQICLCTLCFHCVAFLATKKSRL